MTTYREMMIETEQNLSWCKHLQSENGRVIFAQNEGEICSMEIDGQEIHIGYKSGISAADLQQAAKAANEDYDQLKADEWDDEAILLDVCHEKPCYRCPWFDICEAMDDPDGWDEEEEEEEE